MRARFFSILTAVLTIASAHAMTISGDVLLLDTPPADVTSGRLASGAQVFLWLESGDIDVAATLPVDVMPLLNNPGGLYDDHRTQVQATWAGLLDPGSYDSFLLHADSSARRKTTLSGSVTFDTDIVGIAFGEMTLLAGDPLVGSAGTLYPAFGADRAFDLKARKSWFDISADRRTLAFQTVVHNDINELRIITAADSFGTAPVPVPASVWTFGTAVGLLAWMRRRRPGDSLPGAARRREDHVARRRRL